MPLGHNFFDSSLNVRSFDVLSLKQELAQILHNFLGLQYQVFVSNNMYRNCLAFNDFLLYIIVISMKGKSIFKVVFEEMLFIPIVVKV